MDSTQQLYYALGELCYAMAASDGKLQDAEKKKFWKIMVNHKAWVQDIDFAEVIFEILQKDKTEVETAYTSAILQIELNKHHLTIQMINSYKNILTEIAESFSPVTVDEKELLKRFNADIDKIGPHAA